MLTVEGLECRYGKVAAVRGLSLEVARGELVSLIGANGAGKTTIINTVSGLLRPTAGEIRFAGARIDGQPPERARVDAVRRELAQARQQDADGGFFRRLLNAPKER